MSKTRIVSQVVLPNSQESKGMYRLVKSDCRPGSMQLSSLIRRQTRDVETSLDE